MMQDDDTDQDIDDGESEGDSEGEREGESERTGETMLSSDIEDDDLIHQNQVLLLGQARQRKSSQTTRVPLPKIRSCADIVIARPLLPNPRKPPGSKAPPQLKYQQSALLNESSESDRAPSAQALQQPKSSGDQNALQPKASADQNVPQYQKATFDVAKRFMKAIVFTKTPWPIFSDDKYWMVEEAWKLAIEAQDREQALAGAPTETPSVCQWPSSPSLKIDLQTQEAV
jgi:hypothetical protein